MLPRLADLFRPPAPLSASRAAKAEFTLAYGAKGMLAVTVRADGSACAKWPNNHLAVSVDAVPGGFRTFVAYSTGSVRAARVGLTRTHARTARAHDHRTGPERRRLMRRRRNWRFVRARPSARRGHTGRDRVRRGG